jgi:2-methylisocitrate lyase-like PEP mutase family enzyme
MSLTARQASFRHLHATDVPLLLANAWDAGSAVLIESLGAKAIATTSAGLAWARGYADGGSLPPHELVAAARAITRVVNVPVSIDIETGYSADPAVVAELAARVEEAGGIGINIEDGTDSPELFVRKLEAIRRAVGPGLFINARTDVVLRSLEKGEAAVDAVCGRATAYLAAGCDGIFVPGLADLEAMGTIARAIAPNPLNVMLLARMPAPSVLYQHGVRRLSAGSAIAQAALGHVARLASEFLAGSSAAIFESPSAAYGAVNALFPRT